MANIPPIIKWFGSKRLVAAKIAADMPRFDRYFEPFLGGGAMLPYVVPHTGYASDIISELIVLWQLIQKDPRLVADEYRTRWTRLQKEGPDVYYEVRDSFNRTKDACDFLFITRTCVNGMIRYNSDGEFNNSFHLSRPGINPDTLERQLIQWSNYIKNITFLNVDYRECLAETHTGDFVFLDPPYGGTKDRYTKINFDLDAFYAELERLNTIGVKWILTFDGEAGNRKYNFAPPSELFKTKSSLRTGLSSFKKMMESKCEEISENMYLNFEPTPTYASLFD